MEGSDPQHGACLHRVQFYDDDAFLVDSVARTVGDTLARGNVGVTIATAPHRHAIAHGVRALGVDLESAAQAGRYVALDARAMLARFMVDGQPDGQRFADAVGDVIAAAGARHAGAEVHAFGEMVALLADDGNHEAALRLEELWNGLARRLAFALLCVYPMRIFQTAAASTAFPRIIDAHAAVVPAESYTTLGSEGARLRAVAELQQKATAGEAASIERREALRQRDDAERRTRAAAEGARRAKDEFLAMFSHEMRNPLAAVRSAIATAQLDGARRDRALAIARRQSDHLGRLVDDLLDVARITQGQVALDRQRVCVASIVERAVQTTRPLIEGRAHALTIGLPRRDLYVDGDAVRLEQVVAHLLGNAARYTEPGGRITIAAHREGDQAVLRVRDNGIGIAPHLLSRMFDLFVQSERSLDRAPGGLGIGLTVVRTLVELHGGRVEAASAGLGRGAEFVVRLPALPAAYEPSTQPAARPRPPVAARVLVVEDRPDIADSLKMLMETLGHQVRVARDGEAALAAAQASPPDVMLVDIGLPDIDGYEVARRIRRQAQLEGVVLVALTGYGHDEDRRRALAAGFDHHLVKPVEPDVLQALVVRIGRDPDASSTVH